MTSVVPDLAWTSTDQFQKLCLPWLKQANWLEEQQVNQVDQDLS